MSLIKLHGIFRLKRKNFQNFTRMKAKIIGIIKSVKQHIDFEFRNKQIHENAFYEVQSKLDNILEDYVASLTFFDMGNYNYALYIKKYKQNMQKIRDLIRIYGCNFETIFMVENINFSSNTDLEIVEMLKHSFYSTSYKIMDLNETQPEAEIAAIESLSSSSTGGSEGIERSEASEVHEVSKVSKVSSYFSRITSSSKELINQCYGTRIYLKIINNKILCIDGIFSNWANHLSAALSKHFREKFAKIKERIEGMLTIKQQYKNNWLEQLNLREICCVTVDDIDKELLELTKLHREYKNKKTNVLVNSFINAEKLEKGRLF